DDIFAVQDDIAHRVVQQLRTTLLGQSPDSQASGEARADVARAAKGRGTIPEAHRLYLQARHLNERRAPEDTAKAIEYLQQSLELDPNFALAWAELATAHSLAGGGGWKPAAEAFQHARHAVECALALEPDLAEAHAELGRLRMLHDRD